jgi:hypothetical protein
LVLSHTGSINLGFITEGKLAAVLIITFSWGFQQVFWRQLHASKTAISNTYWYPISMFLDAFEGLFVVQLTAVLIVAHSSADSRTFSLAAIAVASSHSAT